MTAVPCCAGAAQRVLVPKELCDLKPFPAPEVVLLAAFHVSGLVLGGSCVSYRHPAGQRCPGSCHSSGILTALPVLQAFLTRTNNQEVTAIALQPSSILQSSLQDADSGQLRAIPCPPALDSAATIASHASVINTAVQSAPRSAAVPYKAAVALDLESAAAAASASSLGVALLLRSSDGGRGLVAQLVFKPACHATEAARLMAQHLQVSNFVTPKHMPAHAASCL